MTHTSTSILDRNTPRNTGVISPGANAGSAQLPVERSAPLASNAEVDEARSPMVPAETAVHCYRPADVIYGSDGERLIDLPAVLRKVPIARSTLFAHIRDGTFPKGQKLGRRRLWRLAVVDEFLRQL